MNELFLSFQKSLERLSEFLQEEKTVKNRDAAIKRFEFTIELAWKCVQKFLRSEKIICRSPKECLREAFKFGLIKDDSLWLQAFDDRNLTVHAYSEKLADEIYDRLKNYEQLFAGLVNALKTKN